MRLVEDQVLNQNENPLTYTYMTKDPSVSIVVVDEHSNIMLQRQFIYPIKDTLWVVPGGFCDKNETPLETAKRELTEEAGISEADWSELGKYYNAPGISHNIAYGFLATINNPSIAKTDDEEDVSNQTFFSPDTVKTMIANGDIIDGFSLVPLYRYLFDKELRQGQ